VPISLSTKRTFPIWLDSDAEEPMETRPVFMCRFLSADEVIDLQEAAREAFRPGTLYTDSRQRACAALAGKIVGWRNMRDAQGQEIAWGTRPLSAVCTFEELSELAEKAWRQSELSEVDLKKSTSPSASAGDSTSPTAPISSATTVTAETTQAA
jgi:hypothetical protein